MRIILSLERYHRKLHDIKHFKEDTLNRRMPRLMIFLKNPINSLTKLHSIAEQLNNKLCFYFKN